MFCLFKQVFLLLQLFGFYGLVLAPSYTMSLRVSDYVNSNRLGCGPVGNSLETSELKSKDEIERKIVDDFECIINAIISFNAEICRWRLTSSYTEILSGSSKSDLQGKDWSIWIHEAYRVFANSVFKGCSKPAEKFKECIENLLLRRNCICVEEDIRPSDTEKLLKVLKKLDWGAGMLFSKYMIQEKKHSEDLKSLLHQRGKFIEADEIVKRIEKEIVNIKTCFDEITVDSVQWFKMAVSFIEKYDNSSSFSQYELAQFKNLSRGLASKYKFKAELEKKVEEWLEVVSIAAYPHERPTIYS